MHMKTGYNFIFSPKPSNKLLIKQAFTSTRT